MILALLDSPNPCPFVLDNKFGQLLDSQERDFWTRFGLARTIFSLKPLSRRCPDN